MNNYQIGQVVNVTTVYGGHLYTAVVVSLMKDQDRRPMIVIEDKADWRVTDVFYADGTPAIPGQNLRVSPVAA